MGMQLRSVTRDVPQLELRADVVPSTLDAEKRTVQVVWTTGARVKRGFWEPFYEELSLNPKHVRMDRLSSGNAPMLNTHRSYDLSDVVGVVDSAKLEGKRGTATVRFARSQEGEAAFQLVADGIVRNLSVGYRVHKLVKVEDGEDKVPVYRAEDWEPYEISLVPIGADAGAVTRSGGGMMNPCEFIQERAMDPENPTPTNPAPAPSPTLAPQPPITEEQRAAAATAERERVLGIQRRGATLGRPQTEIDEAIRAGTALDVFTASAVDKRATEQTIVIDKRDPRVESVPGGDSRDKFRAGASAWLITRAALGNVVDSYAKACGQKIDLDPGEFRGLSLLDLARESLELSGVRTRGMSKMDVVGLAFIHRGSGMNTTSDFGVLLENVQGKVLQARYAMTPDTYSKICKNGTVTDFRPSPRYRLGTFGKLDKLLEGGEFVHKSIPDGEKQSITADTAGNIIAISRKTIINDDMSAFTGLASDLGRAAKLSIELDFYALLALNAGLGPTMSDGLTLFHATHKNLPAGSALSAANLDLDSVEMGKQTDVSGNEVLDIKPAILLISSALGGQARVINDSTVDPDTVLNKGHGKANIAGKMFTDIVATARLAGTRRYLFADPSANPTFEVAFLDGQQTPYLESQNGFDVDGVKWKVRLDYVVGAIDFRGAVTNAGA